MKLQEYNYTVIYKKGEENGNADRLSHVPQESDPSIGLPQRENHSNPAA
jgi:hypothetical protein